MTQASNAALTLRYAGVSTYTLDPDGSQRVSLFTDQARAQSAGRGAQLLLKDPLGFREGLRTLIELAGLRGAYQPADAEVYASYADWRRSLNPNLTPVELTRALFAFLGEHDPEAWVGCDPTLTLDEQGLSFELLDPSGRLYGAMSVPASAFERLEGGAEPLCAQFEAGVSLREGLGRLHTGERAVLSVGASPDEVDADHRGEVHKRLPAPLSWQRNFTQLLAASTLSPRRVPLSRMDLYNVLQQLRLHADPPKAKKGVRFELIPGKPPALTLEPWGWRLQGTGGVYRGERAELIGVWDRRDLMVFDALLPYVKGVEAVILGEAQPTYWVLDCGHFTFTLAAMGFRPNNWSRGLLLDVALPRPSLSEERVALMTSASERLVTSPATPSELAEALSLSAEEGLTLSRELIQAGLARPSLVLGEAEPRLQARELFEGLDVEASRFRHEREALAHRLVEEGRVEVRLGELPTGEIEVIGAVTEPKAAHMASEPSYEPKFQLKEGAGMRKVSCDCAWMKDREKAKSGPCPHVQALWLRYSLDEAQRLADIAAHPERVEVASSVYVRRAGEVELSRQVSLKRRRLEELWEETGASPRRFHRVFNTIEAARAAYFQRVADLERRDFMDASQS